MVFEGYNSGVDLESHKNSTDIRFGRLLLIYNTRLTVALKEFWRDNETSKLNIADTG